MGPIIVRAQSPVTDAVASWAALTAPTGHESMATDLLAAQLPGWQRDAAGSLIRRRGSGRPRRVVACTLDRLGYAVTRITDNGYLRLHRVSTAAAHPLFDQFHEAQQVNIHTARGVVPGVIAQANGHFGAQHRADSLVATENDLWLDVGARTRAEVDALGIRLMDPVERRVPTWTYAGGVARQAVGAHAGCAAIAAAAEGAVPRGETIYLMTTQSAFGMVGLMASISRLGALDAVTILFPGRTTAETRWRRASDAGSPAATAVLQRAGIDSIRSIAPAVRHAGSLVETIDSAAATRLLQDVVAAAGVDATSLPAMPWVAAPRQLTPLATGHPAAGATDAQAGLAAQLKRFADLPGVAHDEWRVRDALVAEMPEWARRAATTDEAGNLIVGAGPERDTLLIVAHMDEVGYDVTAIAGDGTVSLRTRGGPVSSAWEGQPALLHLSRRNGAAARASIPGVFVPRESARLRRPERMTAWFGLDSAGLVAAGVRVGDAVTAYKDAVRLAGTRFTGRAMDDRAGSLALLGALRAIDPTTLRRRVLFAWSVAEETGLEGAVALASRFGSSVRRVHSIDTFVSSDTPLESPHFAFAPLGDGPVLRAIESSSMAPPAAREEVLAVARRAGIPLQVGLTQGGTDGTTFTFYGAPNVPLSWPGRYSHGPAEILDLQDLERLSALIVALISAR
jgi:putative aminopeptidase FrvX